MALYGSLGSARSAKQGVRSHNGQRALRAAGGMNSAARMGTTVMDPQGCRAIYGSTDRATQDHTNDALCRVVAELSDATAQEYSMNVFRYADHYTIDSTPVPDVPAVLPDLDFLIQRATARGMSIVQYCALQGITLN